MNQLGLYSERPTKKMQKIITKNYLMTNFDFFDEITPAAIVTALAWSLQIMGINIWIAILAAIIFSPLIIINHLDNDIPFVMGVTKTADE